VEPLARADLRQRLGRLEAAVAAAAEVVLLEERPLRARIGREDLAHRRLGADLDHLVVAVRVAVIVPAAAAAGLLLLTADAGAQAGGHAAPVRHAAAGHAAQAVEGVDAGRVPVAPLDLDAVAADE